MAVGIVGQEWRQFRNYPSDLALTGVFKSRIPFGTLFFFASSASSSLALIVSQRFGLRLPETEGPSPPSSSSPSSLVHGPSQPTRSLKLEEDFEDDRQISAPPTGHARDALLSDVKEQVIVLDSTFSWKESDRAAAKRATHALADLAKNGTSICHLASFVFVLFFRRIRFFAGFLRCCASFGLVFFAEEVVNVIVEGGAIPALVKHLQAPPLAGSDRLQRPMPFEHEVEKGSAFALGLLAVKPEHQQLIVDSGALKHLVDLLKRHENGLTSRAINSLIRRAADAITNLAHENSSIKTRVRMEGGIPPLVHLLEFADTKVQRAAAGALRTLAFKNDENKNQIVECNALPTLILMLRSEDAAIHYEAVGVIGNLVHSSPNIKKEVILAGALQPVIGLLRYILTLPHGKLLCTQREAALLLGQFAATDSDSKVLSQFVAFVILILWVRSQMANHHLVYLMEFEWCKASLPRVFIRNSPQKLAIKEGNQTLKYLIMHPILTSTPPNMQVHIVQRGAVGPLIDMLQSPDVQLKEMSAFALGRLAQDTHNQAGIAHNGGLIPLLKLLDSKNGSLQHNAAFALYGLADNEDNVADFIRVGGIQRLQDGEFIVQATKDCVAKTLKRLEEKIHGRVLNHLLYLMRVSEKAFQRRVALALAHLCSADDQRKIFIDHHGLELLMGLLGSYYNPKQQLDGAVALCKLANKATTLSPVDAAPPSPTPQVYLGEQYVNNATLSDVTFLVEGKRFYAHRICLLASSDAFRAMFDGGYREKEARDIEIPNIRWEVFELMMRFIYTGSVEITLDIAQDLLRAADQYLLEGLKRLCEYTIAQDISLESVSSMYELSEAFNAISLRHTCILFILEHFDKLSVKPGSCGEFKESPQLTPNGVLSIGMGQSAELKSFYARFMIRVDCKSFFDTRSAQDGVTVDHCIMHAWWIQRISFGISSKGLNFCSEIEL
ncbi:hypothetical protein V8G54_014051 [Vigna mungo]|uniref:BTB domain-containing protein n=1 Tax=Vigna mungo TaxID=3915 RepID=A0AAQ3NGT7_VIGMU